MRALSPLLLLALLGAVPARAEGPAPRVLRVCADPNNLPFSNRKGEGFENKLAELLAEELHARVEYTWWAQRRGFFRNTLEAGLCDVVLGVPSELELALTTRPYYRSSYVFVWRKDRDLRVRGFDDPKLEALRIGVHLVGDDGAGVPPAHALARRGMVDNVRGYSLYGDYREDSPPNDLLRALERGEIDVAVAWGPLAGAYARHSAVPLTVRPVSPRQDGPLARFVFDISVGVRKKDRALRDELERALAHRRKDVDALLASYGVPRL